MRVAVIGAGVIGRLRAQTVVDNPKTELAGIADVNRVAVAEVATSSRTKPFADYRQMIDELEPTAVIVSSPVMLHEEMCRFALDRGCHVLVEKPLAASLDACRRILTAAEEARRVLAVGFNHRFYPAIRYLKKVLADGRIGTIDHLRIFGGHDGLRNFRAKWMYESELSGGGCMMDVGLHMTDLARHVAGEIVEVCGVASGNVWRVPGSEDNAMAILRTESGVPIIYQSTWTEWRGFGWHVDVYGELGMVRAAYAPMFNMLVTQREPGGKRARKLELYPEIIVREKLKGWETTSKLTFDGELHDFLRMIDGETGVDLADGWSGVRATEVAKAVYRSSAERRPIALAPRDMGKPNGKSRPHPSA
jgi:predicted dehydrogenase